MSSSKSDSRGGFCWLSSKVLQNSWFLLSILNSKVLLKLPCCSSNWINAWILLYWSLVSGSTERDSDPSQLGKHFVFASKPSLARNRLIVIFWLPGPCLMYASCHTLFWIQYATGSLSSVSLPRGGVFVKDIAAARSLRRVFELEWEPWQQQLKMRYIKFLRQEKERWEQVGHIECWKMDLVSSTSTALRRVCLAYYRAQSRAKMVGLLYDALPRRGRRQPRRTVPRNHLPGPILLNRER